MPTDFSHKAAFLQRLSEVLPDDAHFFQFDVAFNSAKGIACATPGQYPTGLRIDRVERETVSIDGKLARYTVGGQL